MTKYFLLVLAFSLHVLPVTVEGQFPKRDLARLQASFGSAAGPDFDILKYRIAGHQDSWRGGTYVLVHVRPKQIGIYELKYSYRVEDKLYYEGTSEFLIRVGGRTCNRNLRIDVPERTMFCLGDTIILPLRVEKTWSWSFDLRSTHLKALETPDTSYPITLHLTKTPPVTNPLERNLTYHGYRTGGSMSRSATGGGTIWSVAVFEAKAPGRFNMGLSKKGDGLTTSIPVIIVKTGTPITAIVPFEKITDYTKGRDYSSANRKSYQSRFLILQPGDTWSETYSTTIIPDSADGIEIPRVPKDPYPEPVITALPFSLKKGEDFYDWMADYVPSGK